MGNKTMLKPTDALCLTGHFCSLVPLSFEHHDALVESTQDGELWKRWYAFVPHPSNMHENIALRLQMQDEGSMIPLAVISKASGKAIGITSYMAIDSANRRVEIGGTWYRQSAQRTSINTECKQLLLTYAFETMQCNAVEFRTHAFNQQSRRAIERLGAKLDGILRNHMILPNGTLRDTCVYSIVASEWPATKVHLDYLLQRKVL